MKKKTNPAVDQMVKRVYALLEDFPINPSTVKISKPFKNEAKGTCILVTITRMYDNPKFAGESFLTGLIALRDALRAGELDTQYDIALPGCETCDFGSQHGWEFVAWKPKKGAWWAQ